MENAFQLFDPCHHNPFHMWSSDLPKQLTMARNSGATASPPRSSLYVKWVDKICNSGKQILHVACYISS